MGFTDKKRANQLNVAAQQTTAEVLAKSELPNDRVFRDAIVTMSGQIAKLIARGAYNPKEELDNLKAWHLYVNAGGGSLEDFDIDVRERAYIIVHQNWAKIEARSK